MTNIPGPIQSGSITVYVWGGAVGSGGEVAGKKN